MDGIRSRRDDGGIRFFVLVANPGFGPNVGGRGIRGNPVEVLGVEFSGKEIRVVPQNDPVALHIQLLHIHRFLQGET